MQPPAQKPPGRVYLIGASPHDFPSSATPAAEYCPQADLVVCEPLLRGLCQQWARPSAELVPLDDADSRGSATQGGVGRVVAMLAQCANAGKVAVHLLDGDPRRFRRDVEELEMLRNAGVLVEVVPGGIAPVEGHPPVAEVAMDARLRGRRVLLTRPADQLADLVVKLRQLGAEVMVQPAIEIGPPESWGPVDEALVHLDRFDWIVFSSVNGVRYVLERLETLGVAATCLAGLKVAAIGPATGDRLREKGISVTVTPPEYRAESLAEALAGQADGQRFLLVRASRGREILAQRLLEAGGEVEQVVAYSSRDVKAPAPGMALAIRAGQFDWTTVTSSAIARATHALFGHVLGCTRLASISPITSDTLRELGHQPAAEAKQYTTEGLVDAILEKSIDPG